MKKAELLTTQFYELYPMNVVLVSTIGKLGIPDVAPYGLNCPISHHPPVIGVGIARDRKTYKNILNFKEFVVNLPAEEMINVVNKTALPCPPEVNKFEEYGLTPIPSLKVKPPSVKECIFHFECKLNKIIDIKGDHDLVIGRVVAATVDKNLSEAKNEKLLEAMKPILYVSGVKRYYALGRFLGERFQL